MKKRIKQTVSLICAYTFIVIFGSQCIAADLSALKANIAAFEKAQRTNDSKTIAALIHPELIRKNGGYEAVVAALNKNAPEALAAGFETDKYTISEKGPLTNVDNTLVVPLTAEMPLVLPSGSGVYKIKMLAISHDSGVTWYFLEGSDEIKQLLAGSLPALKNIQTCSPRLYAKTKDGRDIILIQQNGAFVEDTSLKNQERVTTSKSVTLKDIKEFSGLWVSDLNQSPMTIDFVSGKKTITCSGEAASSFPVTIKSFNKETGQVIIEWLAGDDEEDLTVETGILQLDVSKPDKKTLIITWGNNIVENYTFVSDKIDIERTLYWERKPGVDEYVTPVKAIDSVAISQDGIELLSWDLVVNADGEKHLIGKVKNNTGQDLSYLEATFIYYAANGDHIGTSSLLNTTNLEAGGIWNFDDEVFDEKITQAKFKKFDYQ